MERTLFQVVEMVSPGRKHWKIGAESLWSAHPVIKACSLVSSMRNEDVPGHTKPKYI
jgi:hypothetical protein